LHWWPGVSDHRIAAAISLATADGPGAGRFLAAALLDALNAGAVLLAVGDAPRVPAVARFGIDFVFATDDSHIDEVIRAGVDEHARVVWAELLRCPRRARDDSSRDTGPLAAALAEGETIAEIRWRPGQDSQRNLELVVSGDRPRTLSLAST